MELKDIYSFDFNTLKIIDIVNFKMKYLTRILDKCSINTEDDNACMLWQRALDPDGYGKLAYRYKTVSEDGTITKHRGDGRCHRMIFALTYDSLYLLDPQYKHIDVSHICHTPACCNPLHLETEHGHQNGSRTSCRRQQWTPCPHHPPCIYKSKY